MQITSIAAQKRSNGVNVEIDRKYAFSIKHTNTLTDKNIYKDKIVNEDDIRDILATDFKNIFKERSILLISRRPRSKQEIELYLSKGLYKFFDKYPKYFGENFEETLNKLSQQIVEYLEKRNYLNDEQFASFWIENRTRSKKRSINAIKAELFQKGINRDIISEQLYSINLSDESSICMDIAEKKWSKIRESDPKKKKQKLITYLSSKGFTWETIQKCTKYLCKT